MIELLFDMFCLTVVVCVLIHVVSIYRQAMKREREAEERWRKSQQTSQSEENLRDATI